MPSLKQLKCHVELNAVNIALREYSTNYNDGFVETYIAVPQASSEGFSIHLTSSGYIAPGLAMFVFIDGVYQCNRNRLGLVAPDNKTPTGLTEVEFRVRQKEDKQGDGTFIGRAWKFEMLKLVSADASLTTDSDKLDNIGAIEVVVLRCKSMDQDTPSTPHRGRDLKPSAARAETEHSKNQVVRKPAKVRPAVTRSQKSSSTGGFHGMFDGPADDYAGGYGSGWYSPVNYNSFGRHPSNPYDEYGNRRDTAGGNTLRDSDQVADGKADAPGATEEANARRSYGTSAWPWPPSPTQPSNDFNSGQQAKQAAPNGWMPYQPLFDRNGAYSMPSFGLRQPSGTQWHAGSVGPRPQSTHIQGNHDQQQRAETRKENKQSASKTPNNSENKKVAFDEPKLSSTANLFRPLSPVSEKAETALNKGAASGAQANDDWRNTGETMTLKDWNEQKQASGQADNTAAGERSTWVDNGANVSGQEWGSNNNEMGTAVWEENPSTSQTAEVKEVGVKRSNTRNQVNPKSSRSTHSTSQTPAMSPRSHVKAYWSCWSTRSTPEGIRPEARSSGSAKALYIAPAEPLVSVPEEVAKKSNMSHQVQAGRGARYLHRVGRPEYLDTLDKPYAVFTFKYRSKEVLEKMLGKAIMEHPDDFRKRMLTLSKEEIVTELMKVKLQSDESAGDNGSGGNGSHVDISESSAADDGTWGNNAWEAAEDKAKSDAAAGSGGGWNSGEAAPADVEW